MAQRQQLSFQTGGGLGANLCFLISVQCLETYVLLSLKNLLLEGMGFLFTHLRDGETDAAHHETTWLSPETGKKCISEQHQCSCCVPLLPAWRLAERWTPPMAWPFCNRAGVSHPIVFHDFERFQLLLESLRANSSCAST